MNKKIAVFPGSFDPITLGHYDIIIRGLNLFDKIVIAIGKNFEKKNMFSLKKRKQWIQKTFLSLSQEIEIDSFKGLTISFCIKKKAKFLLRGIRNQLDFEFEKNIYLINKELYKKHIIETVYLFSSYDKSHISSYIVRDVIKNGGDYTTFVPSSVRI